MASNAFPMMHGTTDPNISLLSGSSSSSSSPFEDLVTSDEGRVARDEARPAPPLGRLLTSDDIVDDILDREVGFGWAQYQHVVLVCLPWIVGGMLTMATIFTDRPPDCIPQFYNGTQVCTPIAVFCDLEPSQRGVGGGTSASTILEWNLICDERDKANLVGPLFFFGSVIGDLLYPTLSDTRLGRKGALALACIMTSCTALLSGHAPSFWIYTVSRFLAGMNVVGIGSSCLVLATELVGPNWKDSVGILAFCFYSSGIMILPAYGYLNATSWRRIYFSIGITGLIYCASVLPFLSESPRWWLIRGNPRDQEEALRILTVFARKNGKVLPPGVRVVADPRADVSSEVDRASNSLPIRDIFRVQETRWNILLLMCISFTVGLSYFGINLNVVNLDFNLYLAVFFNGLTELPAFIIILMMLWLRIVGKKLILIFALCLSGCSCLLGGLIFLKFDTQGHTSNAEFRSMDTLSDSARSNTTPIPGHSEGSALLYMSFEFSSEGAMNSLVLLRLLCAITGLFGVVATQSLLNVYTVKLFSTDVRTTAVGLTSLSSGIGSVMAPLVAVLGLYHPSTPFFIFGLFSLFGAALGLRLPECLESPKRLKRTETKQVSTTSKKT